MLKPKLQHLKNGTLFGSSVFTEEIKLKYIMRVGPNLTGVLVKRGNLDTEIHMHRGKAM